MRFSQAFIPTLKEKPAEAEIPSHTLMIRSGMLRKTRLGYLFLSSTCEEGYQLY